MQEKDLLEIISKLRAANQEGKTLDAKQELVLHENGDKAEFVKDIVAMANNEEKSYIVIGLQDGTFSDIGVLRHHYQKNDLNQILVDKIDPPIVVEYQEFTINNNEYGLIEIVGYDAPYIVARDLVHNKTDRKRTKIYKGTILVRHEDRTEGISRSELEELLRRRGLRKEFESETKYTQQLVFGRPKFWEYLLTAELLRSKLAFIRRRFADLEKGIVYKKTTSIKINDFFNWTILKCEDFAILVGIATKVVNEELPPSWGPPGVAGDPLEIKRAVDKLVSVCNDMIEWEADLYYTTLPPQFHPLKQKMEGWTLQFLKNVESISEKLTESFNPANSAEQYYINIVFEVPPRVPEFITELQLLGKSYRRLP